MPEIPPGPWPTKRDIFLQLLESAQPQGKNRMTIIFDNREGPGGREMRGPVEIIFTNGESADDWIIAQVRKMPNPRIAMVVTDDQSIRRMIRGTGARWMPTQDFLRPATQAPLFRTKDSRDRETRDSITEELKKKWLQ